VIEIPEGGNITVNAMMYYVALENKGRVEATNASPILTMVNAKMGSATRWIGPYYERHPVRLKSDRSLLTKDAIAEFLRSTHLVKSEETIQAGVGAFACLFFTIEGSNNAYIPRGYLDEMPMPFEEQVTIDVSMDGYTANRSVWKGVIHAINWNNGGHQVYQDFAR
jgi:hypothetical protein